MRQTRFLAGTGPRGPGRRGRKVSIMLTSLFPCATFSYTVLEGAAGGSPGRPCRSWHGFGFCSRGRLDTSLPSTHTLPLAAFIAHNELEEGGLARTRLADEGTRILRVPPPAERDPTRAGHPGVYTMVTSSKHHGTIRSGSIVSVRLGNDGVTPRLQHAEKPAVWFVPAPPAPLSGDSGGPSLVHGLTRPGPVALYGRCSV